MNAICFKNVTKEYDLYFGQKHVLYALKSFLGMSAKNQLFTALNDISFEIKKGDFVGLFGTNGSGKSTMLKLISHVTYPTNGKVVTTGKISSLIELGIGFNGELTGLDNLYLNGLIMGISKSEIAKNIDSIVDFAEIKDFINVPIKRYSTGMVARLSFAISIFTKADILLIDEVLSVTDINFQMKCLNYLKEFSKKGGTVLLASHSMVQIKDFCNISMVLEKGKIVYLGSTDKSIEYYYQNHNK